MEVQVLDGLAGLIAAVVDDTVAIHAQIFTDPGDVVIDPCAGSGSTLRAAYELGRSSFGFEIDRNFYQRAKDEMLNFAD